LSAVAQRAKAEGVTRHIGEIKWRITLERIPIGLTRPAAPALGSMEQLSAWLRKFPANSLQFPAHEKKFPAPLRREFLLETIGIAAEFSPKKRKIARIGEIPCKIPCRREFNGGRATALAARIAPIQSGRKPL
jgi:hypothetical protein